MGAACASGMTAFSSRTVPLPVKILLIGKQNAGKTFLLYSWKFGVDYIMSIEPTSHFNVDTIISPSGQKYLVYDLAGNIGYRLRPFLDGTNGVIYMLGTRGENFLLEKEQNNIKQLLQERELENVPVLFVIRDGTYTNDLSANLPEKLRTALEGRLWEAIEIRQNSQEDADLVLSVLEKLLIKPEQLETS